MKFESAFAHCFTEASARYNVPASLLKAIARHESGGRTHAVNTNTNGTRDIGLMQINSGWLPVLNRHGLKEKDLENRVRNNNVRRHLRLFCVDCGNFRQKLKHLWKKPKCIFRGHTGLGLQKTYFLFTVTSWFRIFGLDFWVRFFGFVRQEHL